MSNPAVVYLRVSTDDQADSGLGLDAQRAACLAFASAREWPIAGVFADEGVSGSKPLDKRPGLIGAVGALARGGVLLVKTRDRVFRTDEFDRAVILREIRSRGARLVAADGGLGEDDSPDGRMLATILDSVGARERAVGIARTNAALAVKRARGERCGQVPYGLRVADDGKTLVSDPADAGLADACARLRAEGRSLRAVAAALPALGYRPKRGAAAFAPSTIRRLIKARSSDERRGPCPAPTDSTPSAPPATANASAGSAPAKPPPPSQETSA